MPSLLPRPLLKSVNAIILLLAAIAATAEDDQLVLENFRCENAAMVSILKMIQAQTGVALELKGNNDFINGLPRLNMEFDRIPAAAMIQILCEEGNLDYKINGRKITFSPYVPSASDGDSAPAKTRRPPGTRMTIGTTSAYPVGWTKPRMVVQDGSVTVIGPVPRFRKVTSGVDVSTWGEDDPPVKTTAKNKPPVTVRKKTVPASDGEMVELLSAIPVNNVRLQNVPLANAVNELRSLSRARASGQAVNLYLSCHVDNKASLTMTLDNMNLYDALRYVSRAAGVKMTVLSWGVMLSAP